MSFKAVIRELDTDPGDGSRGYLWKMLEDAQYYAVRRPDVRRWINTSLRVLILSPSANAKEQSRDFQLVPHSIDSDVPYIAVSYCWQTKDDQYGGDSFVHNAVHILQNGRRRPSRARPEIILRAMRYAASVGVNRIWIDQECIDQDDPIDKEHGIQSMDLVYQYAYRTVALLDRYIHCEDDVRSVAELMAQSFKESTASELNSGRYPLSIPLVNRLIEDRWFSRSWTLQEYICACRVVLLIAWDQTFAQTYWGNWKDELLPSLIGLEDKVDFGDSQETYGEWSISERLWSHMVANLPDAPGEVKFDDYHEPNLSIDLTKQWAARQAKSTALEKAGHSCASAIGTQVANALPFLMDAAMACNSLSHKSNHRVLDKVAIVANLCGYQWGINVDEVERKGLGLISCLLAQALLNGDLSLLSRCEDDVPFSGWQPACDSAFLYWSSDGLAIHDQLRPALIHDSCLILEGYLCKITSYDGFAPLQTEIKQLISRPLTAGRPASASHLNHWISRRIGFISCIWLILRQLSTLKHWALFEVIIAWSNLASQKTIKDRMEQIRMLLQRYPDRTTYPPEFGQLLPMTGAFGSHLSNMVTLIAYGHQVLCAVPVGYSDDHSPCALLLRPGCSSEFLFITEYYAKGEVTSWVRPSWGVRICEEPVSDDMLGRAISRFQGLGVPDAREVFSNDTLEISEYIHAAFCRDAAPGARRMYIIR